MMTRKLHSPLQVPSCSTPSTGFVLKNIWFSPAARVSIILTPTAPINLSTATRRIVLRLWRHCEDCTGRCSLPNPTVELVRLSILDKDADVLVGALVYNLLSCEVHDV